MLGQYEELIFSKNQRTIQIQEQNQAAQVQQMQLIDPSAATSQHQAQNNAVGNKYVNGKFRFEEKRHCQELLSFIKKNI